MIDEHQPISGAPAPADGAVRPGSLDDPRALQILSTEHWSLIASRSLAYNEAFARAGMYLTFLSATLIVMGFLIGSETFRPVVVPVLALLLLADLLVGLATLGRLIDASREELLAVRGMNRIRHAYREMLPDVEPYFITGFHDDARGVLATYGGGFEDRSVLSNVVHGLTTTTGMIGTVDALVLGALSAVVGIGVGLRADAVIALGVAMFLLAFGGFLVLAMRRVAGIQSRMEARFPTPPE